MKRTLILISALFLMSMGVLAQMNIWRNGVVTHEFLLADVDSITFGAIQETEPGINIDPDTENYERTLLIEFFTGQGAGYDPTGIAKIQEGINGIEDRVVWTSHHAGYGADDFTISNSESLVSVFGINGVPSMMLNRTNTTFAYQTQDGGTIDQTLLIHTPTVFADATSTFVNELSKEGDASVHIKTSLEGTELTVLVYGAVKEQQDIRLTVYVQENGLIAEQKDFTLPSPSVNPNFEHNHVPRVFLSATLGDAITPASRLYQKVYRIELNNEWNFENCEVVAFVTRKAEYQPVLNAASVDVVANNLNDDDLGDAEYIGMSEQWAELNRMIKEDFNTTVTIPEPEGEYQFTVTKSAPFSNWVSGRYELTFNPQMIDAVLNYPQVLKKAGWKKVLNGNEEQGYATYYSDTQDYLIMPYIDETSHQFAILYIYNRNDVGTIDNWEEIEDKVTEVSLKGNIWVDTYYGESFPIVDETEAYTLILTNEQAGTTYSVSLASYPNDLAAPVEATYTIVDELTTADQATVTKVIGEGEGAVEVAAESGTLVISGNASNMEITLNIALADGDHETLHYSGQVQVEENKWEMVSEQEALNITSMTLETSEDYAMYNYYYFVSASSEYPARGQLSAIVSSPQYPNGIMQILLSFLFNGTQQNATALPVGTYPFANMYNGDVTGENLDFVTASDYYIYQYAGSYYSEIYTITSDGVTNIFFPQSGTLKIENGTTEGTMKFTINATSFNGSTFQGTFELPEYVEPSSAPQRLAPKAAPQWNTYLLKDAKLPNVPYKRAMR